MPESDDADSNGLENTSNNTADYVAAENQIAHVLTNEAKASWREDSITQKKLYKLGHRQAYTPIFEMDLASSHQDDARTITSTAQTSSIQPSQQTKKSSTPQSTGSTLS